MGFFLVKSPLALAVGEALIVAGSIVEIPDDAEASRLVANGTLDPAEIDPAQAEVFAKAKADAGIPPGDVMVATPDQIISPDHAADPAAADIPEADAAPTRKGKAKA